MTHVRKMAMEIFEEHRIVPYEPPHPNKTLETDNSCLGKNHRMINCFRDQRYEVRPRFYLIDWRQQGLSKRLLESVREMNYHLAPEVKINDVWYTVDCSLDPKLQHLNWYARSDTPVAVRNPIPCTPAENIELYTDLLTEGSYRRIAEVNSDFFLEYSTYLKRIRGMRK
jgi:hypothetical protein